MGQIGDGGLTPVEVRQFHDQGYLGPFELCTPAQMQARREQLDDVVYGRLRSPYTGTSLQARHLDSPAVYELCADPAIVTRVNSILGPDLLLWQSNFFNKEPGTQAYPWHQDRNFWAGVLEPPITVSAWLAIDPADLENSCVQLLPGSHKQAYGHVDTQAYDQSFKQEVDPDEIVPDDDQAVSMQLRPGQFFLFNERMLHRSSANTSSRRRLGLAVRITTPITRVYKDHPVLLLTGEDTMGFNSLGEPPDHEPVR